MTVGHAVALHDETMIVCGGTRGGYANAEVLPEVLALDLSSKDVERMRTREGRLPRWERLFDLDADAAGATLARCVVNRRGR